MLNKLLNKVSSASSLPHKLMWYFSAIAIMIGLTIYLSMLGLMQWIEDEVNQHELETSAPYAISLFQQGAKQPLDIGMHVQAFYSLELIPEKYGELGDFPIGFNGEVYNDNQVGFLHELVALSPLSAEGANSREEIFLYRGEFLLDGQLKSLFLIMPTENVELSDTEWTAINLFVLCFIGVLFGLFGFAIHKLSRRLVEPVEQLSRQLKSTESNKTFSVSDQSAAEFRELADSLNHYRQQNEMMMKQEQAFARYASHELRTPLTVISGAAKLQEQNNALEFQARQRGRIQRAALDMQHTIDALLNLVKQERATGSNPPRSLSLDEVQQIIQPLQGLANSKSINISINFEQAPVIKPAPAVLRMLLTNVISNAINASNSGEITISINRHEIVITDKGRGLTESEQDNEHGHGLGLLIVDSLCQRYHWQFNLSNMQPTGCSAQLTFPLLTL
ncbi:HAMP domain-containing histidine kinase [Shewanella gelidimarina]|uniref:sensor histidine kinase n=1 Tax=Shewanella gelidimarina TaxID=56813 RepID=UPI00200C67D1|nr:HAMP domain-containing sensor histidine kinase [Shewanella gelidimarina]MCL1057251.1 HAMP domain-containing histidine kinase [Shewanella gelidimarina]